MTRKERIFKVWLAVESKILTDLEGLENYLYFIYKTELKERGKNYKPVPIDEWLIKGYQSKDNKAVHKEIGAILCL